MASELLVKRLMKQASVSVLAGLLMSSAVLAEDMSEPVGEPDVVAVDDSGMVDDGMVDGGPDVSIDPVDPGEWDGVEDGFEPGDEGDGTDGGEVDGGEGAVDPECAECSGIPDVSIDPIEMGEPTDDVFTVTMADGAPRGGQPNERGDDLTGGHEVSRDQRDGAGRERDHLWKLRRDLR